MHQLFVKHHQQSKQTSRSLHRGKLHEWQKFIIGINQLKWEKDINPHDVHLATEWRTAYSGKKSF